MATQRTLERCMYCPARTYLRTHTGAVMCLGCMERAKAPEPVTSPEQRMDEYKERRERMMADTQPCPSCSFHGSTEGLLAHACSA